MGQTPTLSPSNRFRVLDEDPLNQQPDPSVAPQPTTPVAGPTGLSPTNRFRILDAPDEAQQTLVRSAWQQAGTTTPERHADVLRIASASGLPVETIERDYDKLRRQYPATPLPAREVSERTPGLANWLTDPNNAKLVKQGEDELQAMGGFEWFLKAPGRTVAQEINRARYAALRSKEILGGTLTREEQDAKDSYKFHVERDGDGAAGESFFGKAWTGMYRLFTQMGPAAGYGIVGAAAGGVVGGVAGSALGPPGTATGAWQGARTGAQMGMAYGTVKSAAQLEMVETYDELLTMKDDDGRPIDPQVARIASITVGGLNGAIELVGLEAFLKRFPGLDKLSRGYKKQAIKVALRNPTVRGAFANLAKSYAGGVGMEVLQEVAQRGVSIAGEELAKFGSGESFDEQRRTPQDAWDDLAETAVQSVPEFALGMLPGPSLAFARDVGRAKRAEASVQFFTGIGEGVKNMPVAERMPAAFQRFVEGVTEDTPVKTLYQDANSWVAYWQSKGQDPAEMAATVTGDEKALEKAGTQGGMIVIPTARYATALAGTEHNAYFVNELRLGPDEMNGRESAEFKERIDAEKQRIADEAAREAQTPEARELADIKADITERLSKANVSRETAGTIVEFLAGVGQLAQRAGMGVRELYEPYGLDVVRTTAPTQGTASSTMVMQGAKPTPGEEEIPGLAALEESLGSATIEQLGDETITENASGESDASREDQQRMRGMRARGEQFVVYDRAGRRRVLITGGVDYTPKKGETYGVETPQGFSVRQDNGGRIPGDTLSSSLGRSITTLFQGPKPLPAVPTGQKVDGEMGEASAGGERANFIGYQEGFRDIPTMALYNIHGGERDGSTVDAETLTEMGIPIPPTPPLLEHNSRILAASLPLQQWFGQSVVVDETGQPLVVFHGTTNVFTSFDTERGNVEADFGKGFYFSNNAEDVGENYATVGPDLTNKIERRAEELQQAAEYQELPVPDHETAMAQARAEMVSQEGLTMPVFLRIERPAELGGPHETRLTLELVEDEDGNISEERGTMLTFISALQDVAASFHDADVAAVAQQMIEHGDGLTLREAIQFVRESQYTEFATDDDGNLAVNELIRAALERAGYDGIVDRTVDLKFGSQRRVGRAMAGMDEDTVHYIVFSPNQIKSAIGNSGAFDPTSPDILYQSALTPSPASHVYYSKLVKALEASKQGAATGKQWKAMIGNVGVNRDEFAIAKIEDLDDAARYTKAEVIAYVQQHAPLPGLVVLGESGKEGEIDDADREVDQDAVDERAQEIRDRMEADMIDDMSDSEWHDLTGEPTVVEEEIEDEIVEQVPQVDDVGNVILSDETGRPLIETITRVETRTVYYPALRGGYRETRSPHGNFITLRPRYGATDVIEGSDPYDDEDDAERAAEAHEQDLRSTDRFREKVYEWASENVDYDEAERRARRELDDEGALYLDSYGGATGPPTQYHDYKLEPAPEEGSYREVFPTAGNVEQSEHIIGPTKKEISIAMFGIADVRALNPIQREIVDAAFTPGAQATLTEDEKAAQLETLAQELFGTNYAMLTSEQQDVVQASVPQSAHALKTIKWNWRDGHDKYSNVKNPIVRIRLSVRRTLGELLPPQPVPELNESEKRRVELGVIASEKLEGLRVQAVTRRRDEQIEERLPEEHRLNPDAKPEDDDYTSLNQARQYFTDQETDAYWGWRNERDDGAAIEEQHVRNMLEAAKPRHAPGKRVLFLEEVQAPQPKQQKKMPPIFVRKWRDIAFKFALHYAVENDLDVIAWTTGQQQADFWDLNKTVKRVEVNTVTITEKARVKPKTTLRTEAEGGFALEPEPEPAPYGWGSIDPDALEYETESHLPGVSASRGKELGITRYVTVQLQGGGHVGLALNNEGTVVEMDTYSDGLRLAGMHEHIDQFVGAEVAAQIMAHEHPTEELRIEGKGLRIGGTGLAQTYEVDFKNTLNDIPAFKKKGGTVGFVPMLTKVEWSVEDSSEVSNKQLAAQGLTRVTDEDVFVTDGSGRIIKQFSTSTRGHNAEQAQAFINANKKAITQQPAAFLTKEVADAVAGGQAFLQPGRYRPVSGVERQARDQELQAVIQGAVTAAPEGSGLAASITVTGEVLISDLKLPSEAPAGGASVMRAVLEHADARNMQVAVPESVVGERDGPVWRALTGAGFIENGAREFYDASSEGTLVRPSREARIEQGEKKEGKPPRGALSWTRDRKFTISLFEHADLSTFLHELGHFYLEVMGDVIDKLDMLDSKTLTPQQLQLMADYKTLLAHIGVTDRNQITGDHHEKMAESFETYLHSGKAPSLALRGAFARVRAWFVGVYRSLKSLRAPLTPEVTKVFDRLLASDEAIAEAEAAGELAPMWLTPEQAGMSHERFALYRDDIAAASQRATETLDAAQMAEVQREQEAQYRERKAEVRAEVTAQAHAMPVYKAMAAMRTGKQPNGQPLTEGEPVPMKLSKAMLIEQFGKEILSTLPKAIYSKEGGVAAGAVAEAFGFDSGDALLQAVRAAKPMQVFINEETDRRMLEEEPPMALDGSIHEVAKAAAANENREKVLREELKALARKKRDVSPFVAAAEAEAKKERDYERRWLEAEAKLRIAIAEGRKQVEIDVLQEQVSALRTLARQGPSKIRGALPSQQVLTAQAREAIAGMRIADLNPMLYWGAMRRASKAATEAAARQDFDEAILQKHRELIAMTFFREVSAAKKDAEKRVKAAKQIGTPGSLAKLMLAGKTYHDQVCGVLDRFEFATVPQTVLDRRASMHKWILGQEAVGNPVDLPDDIIDESRRVNYKQLTVEELIGVTDGLKELLHMARFKNRLLKNARTRDLKKLVREIDESIRAHKGALPAERRDRTTSVERGRMVKNYVAGHRKLASLLRELDGFKDGGIMWESIMRPLNDAGAREADMNAQATRQLSALLEAAYPGTKKASLYARTFIPAINGSLSRMERIMFALNAGNTGNLGRVLEAEKWSPAQLQAVLDTLDAKDAEFVQGVFDLVNSYWDAIAAKQVRVFGQSPKKVEAKPFTIGDVQMRGGYFPIKYDDRLSAVAQGMIDLDKANLQKAAAFGQATTARGHTKARAEAGNKPVRLDFGVFNAHIGSVIHDLTHHEALIDIGRILAHDTVQKAIIETHGDIMLKAIKNAVRDAAFGDVPAGDAFEKILNHTRAGVTVVGLAWSFTTPIMQLLGYANATVRVRPTWMAKGLMRAVGLGTPRSMVEQLEWIYEVSPMMKTRALTQDRQLNELRNEVGVYSGKFTPWIDAIFATTTFNLATRKGVADSYFYAIGKMQQMVDVPTWLGAYEKAMAEGGAAGGDHERAVALADQAVLDTQGGGQMKDLAAVQRGGPALRIFTNFYTAGNVLFNQLAEVGIATKWTNPASVGRAMVDYMLLLIIPGSLSYFISQGLKGGDDEDDRSLGEALAKENLIYLLGSMVGFRELTGSLRDFYGYEGPPGARVFASANRVIRRVSRDIAEGELTEQTLRSLGELGGILFHFPVDRVWKFAQGAAALAEGRSSDPRVVITGVEEE